LVSAHSWVQCADYGAENGRVWNQTLCRGWPRGYSSIFGAQGTFGQDVGYNYIPTEAAACRPTTGERYSTAFPQASYNPGQRVCLAWPPKNHVAAKCNNPYIPDHGTKILRSGLNPTADPTLTQFRQNLVHDFGANKNLNGTGFQNCPQFCANNDKALCTGCFEIPSDLALGKYTFLWQWEFNSEGLGDTYTTCFDVNIVAKSGNWVKETWVHYSPDDYPAHKASDKPTINPPPSVIEQL